jgi:hypothetical protein
MSSLTRHRTRGGHRGGHGLRLRLTNRDQEDAYERASRCRRVPDRRRGHPAAGRRRGPDRRRPEEPAPATIAAAPTTRVKALDLLFRGSTVPASYDAPSYAVVMTGHFASYRGGPHRSQIKLPRRGRCLVVVIDASTLMATDATMHDQDDTGLLAQLGPVATLSQ